MPYLVVSRMSNRMFSKLLGRMLKRCLPGLLLLGLCCAAHAQQEAEPPTRPRRLILYFQKEADSAIGSDELLLLHESLALALSKSTRAVRIIEGPASDAPPSREAMSGQTRGLGGDCWLQVRVSGDLKALHLAVRSYDLLSKGMAFEFELDKTKVLGTRGPDRRLWDEVTAAVRENYKPIPRREVRTKRGEGTVVFRGLPGTRLIGLAEEPLLIGVQEEVQVELSLPATYSLLALRRGYDPVKRQIYLDWEVEGIELDQRAGPRLEANFYLHNLSFPGADMAFYFIPHLFFVRLGITSYLLGLSLRGERDEQISQSGILVSRPLLHLNLAAGVYLNGAHRLFRVYLAAGLFSRILFGGGYGILVEPIAPFGLQPALGLELAYSLGTRLYLEYAPLLYYTRYSTWLRASFPVDSESSAYFFADPWVMNLLNFNIGVRLRL